jgi:hypothetical protein
MMRSAYSKAETHTLRDVEPSWIDEHWSFWPSISANPRSAETVASLSVGDN